MPEIIIPSGAQPAAADDQAPTEVPYHMYEVRFLEDSEGRRIEFRQLVPGSADPGPERFTELIGQTVITMRMQMPGSPPVDRRVPVQFPIPMVGPEHEAILNAFKVFDDLAAKARDDAGKKLEADIARKKQEVAGRVVPAPPGMQLPPQPGTPR